MATVRVFRQYVHTPFLMLAGVEAGIFMLSVYAGAYLRFFGVAHAVRESIGPLLPRALAYAAIMLLSMLALGLYQPRMRESSPAVLLRLGAAFALGGIAMTLLFYLIPTLYLGRGALALAGIMAFFVVGTVRPVFMHTVDENPFRNRLLVLGAGVKAASMMQWLRRRSDQRDFRIVGFVPTEGDGEGIEAARRIKVGEGLWDYCRTNQIDEVVVAMDERRSAFPTDQLLQCKMGGVRVTDVASFFERETGKVKLDLLYPSWMIFSDGYQAGVAQAYLKRTFDILVSLLLLALTWPVMLAVALAIRVESGRAAPVLFRQERVGQQGRIFHMLKFRSMVVDAESDGQARWAEQNDMRITRVGRFIRKYRLDELPQVFNVLRGDMSFVGPRPERQVFVDRLAAVLPYYVERHRVKPGITGWAQLHYPYGASEADAREKLQYDLYYVKNYTLLLDLAILLQTVEVVLFGKGSR